MNRLALASLAVGLLLLGCSDHQATTGPGQVNPAISDGTRSSGNPGFFWLPPMVPSPTNHPNYTPGGFASGLAAGMRVEICRYDVDPVQFPNASCNLLRVFTASEVKESLAEEHYKVLWDTKERTLDPDKFYRIRWLYSDLLLGYADVDVVSSGSGLKNVVTGEFIGLLDGRTLPITARVEHDAFTAEELREALLDDPESDDFVIAVVPDTRGSTQSIVVLTSSEGGGAEFPAGGWLPQSYVNQFGSNASVLFVMERVTIGEGTQCHVTDFPQAERCYIARTIPALFDDFGEFSNLVTIGMCTEVAESDPWHILDVLQLHRSEGQGEPVPLPNRPFTHVACDEDPGPITFMEGGPLHYAKSLLGRSARRVGSWISPRPLHAVDLGLGGGTLQMSNFGWVARVTASIHSGNGQTATVGSQVTVQVKLTSTHPGSATPVSGEMVNFQIGTQAPISVTTDANGVATFAWTLGSVGNNTLLAHARANGSPLTFTATGTEAADFIFINFDTDTEQNPVTSGTVINNLYQSLGVTFQRVGIAQGTCGSGPEVYANNNLGSSGLLTGNTISLCTHGTASDFSENTFGMVQANFAFTTSQVCVTAVPVDIGHVAVLEAFGATGAILATETLNTAGSLCVLNTPGISGVRFAGQESSFARFDNLAIGVPPIID